MELSAANNQQPTSIPPNPVGLRQSILDFFHRHLLPSTNHYPLSLSSSLNAYCLCRSHVGQYAQNPGLEGSSRSGSEQDEKRETQPTVRSVLTPLNTLCVLINFLLQCSCVLPARPPMWMTATHVLFAKANSSSQSRCVRHGRSSTLPIGCMLRILCHTVKRKIPKF